MSKAFTLSFKRPPDWWYIRIYYFIFIGGAGLLWPFLTLFYARQGLTGTQIGLLGSIGAVIGLVAAPIWGRWSDRAQGPHRLLQLSLISSMALMLLVSQQSVFIWIAVLIGLNAFVTAGSEPLSTVLALEPPEDREKPGFGSIRLWGSLGWAVLVLFSGWMIERAGIFSAFFGYGLSMICSAGLLGLMWSKSNKRVKEEERSQPETWNLVRQLIHSRPLLVLAWALMIGWFSRYGIFAFEPLFMESLGAGETIIGLASTLGALIELPAMLWADQLIKKFGAWRMIQLGFGLHALTALGILTFPTITAILISRLIGGIAFSLETISLVDYLNDEAPQGRSATALALYTITLPSMIALLAAPISGRVFDVFGPYWLYALAFAGGLLSLSVSGLARASNPIKGEFDV